MKRPIAPRRSPLRALATGNSVASGHKDSDSG
jgi:hypothetical protein